MDISVGDENITTPEGEATAGPGENASSSGAASASPEQGGGAPRSAASPDADVSTPGPLLKNVVEAVLFVTPEPLPLKKLAALIGAPPLDELKVIIAELQREYRDRGVELVQVAGRWRFFSREEYAPWAKKVLPIDAPPRLSRAALETLSIIAYRQPITRVAVEEIRGVNCDGVLRTLSDRGFITTSGREDVPGRPYRYKTTKYFLRYFGMASLEDLPPLEEGAPAP